MEKEFLYEKEIPPKRGWSCECPRCKKKIFADTYSYIHVYKCKSCGYYETNPTKIRCDEKGLTQEEYENEKTKI